jgi:PAS domain S-box-containing protein
MRTENQNFPNDSLMNRTINETNEDIGKLKKKADSLNKIFLLCFICIAIICSLFVRDTWTSQKSATEVHAMTTATTSATLLDGEMFKCLNASADDEQTIAYKSIKQRLIALTEQNKFIRFAYFYTKRNEKLFFMVDSEPKSSKDMSPPGQEYTEEDPEALTPFITGKTLLTKPTTDRWGTWISVLVPIKNHDTGKTIAVFGVDFPAKNFYNDAKSRTYSSSIISFLAILILFGFYRIVNKNYRLQLEQKKTLLANIKLIEKEKEQKQAEDVLNRERILLRTLIESIPDSIYVKNIESRKILANKANCHNMGFQNEEEVIGKNDFDIYPPEIAQPFYEDDQQVLKYGKSIVNREEKLIIPNGEMKWLLTSKLPLYDENGIITGLVGVGHDITKRKKAEEDLKSVSTRLSLATKAGGVGVWDYDLVNNDLDWDDQMFALYNIDKQNYNSAYEAWRAGIHPDDVAQDVMDIQMAISGEKEFDTEFRIVWPDGSIHNIKALGLVLRDDSGSALRMIGTNWDITEKKKVEENLQKAVAAAEAASKAKSEFLANMSHEIRTPLNGVIGFTDLLQSTPLSPVQHQYVQNANISGHTLLGIINDILDFSKIEAGMMDLEIIKTDIRELIGQSADIIKYAADKKGLEVLLNIDSDMPRFAAVDAVRLKQIFANLMGNAVKFTEKGEIELKVVYENIGNKKGKFLFSVRDTGIGITAQNQTKLFKSFSQADSSTTRKFGGTGLGLVISEMIAQKMGSKINIKSQLGKGSTFYFELVTEVEYGEKVNTDNIQSIKRCFVIDDNENNRIIIEHTMANWGIECVSCDNGLDALKIIETSEAFDVVVCDYHMPYIDGLETIKLIREKLKLSPDKLPIILLHSSSDDAELHKKCDEYGVRFRLTKPVKAEDLYSYFCNINSPFDTRISPENKSSSTTDNAPKTLTILIAEDVEMNMLLIKFLLGKILPDAKMIEAIDGQEAVAIWQKEKPDLILMDMQMPVMDGIEATIKIRELEEMTDKCVPIIALTAGAMKEEKEKCLAAGMDDFLTKPIEPEKLSLALKRFLK